MSLRASDIDEMIEGGESVHRIVRELILALGRRGDAVALSCVDIHCRSGKLDTVRLDI
jgi:hypothetical protein